MAPVLLLLPWLVAADGPATPPAAAPAPTVVVSPGPVKDGATPVRLRVLVLETRADAALVEKVRSFGDLFATVLEARTSAEVVPSSSVRDRIAVAAEKLQAGCDDTQCMTEIAGALDARFVVGSRASQIGGRWLMRIELFDSHDLKVIGQASAMSDSVEGLAAQAETMADALLEKVPALGKNAAVSTTTSDPNKPKDAADHGGPGAWPWVVAVGSSLLAVTTATTGVISFNYALGKEGALNSALDDFHGDDNKRTRAALAQAGREASNSSYLHDCLLGPLGCMSLPLLGVAGWGVYWGVTAKDEDKP